MRISDWSSDVCSSDLYAARLGMNNSHFADASGLPDPNHYTTARDLTILARALIHDFPDWYKIFAERDFTYNQIHQPNRNGLLEKDPSVDGIQTGHTSEAGYCLLTSAVRDGRRLDPAGLGTKSWAAREQSSLELLNYGFRFFDTTRSEEHTSELQSLMRTSYAVFCLKK